MPYIKQKHRDELAQGKLPENAGELNFQITTLLLDYVKRQGKSYKIFNEVMGVIACVGQEFYRRWVAPYEDEKIKENGDVS